ncbi:tRNA-uridine aminocarboxypropyltransferase 1 [Caerostris extrusa]|uniref:tRNA-uridine aminocarboxypropyltransferase 1 n=1 Tax=Caerostris extrusa TaxID=172846 RepID=A0AAV4XBF9_CAEEX|nr:tRNA-uridine aminocarboxypropyltransferase 1 [Caerostris extrusa]
MIYQIVGTCTVCNRSRKYYCYTCYVPVKEVSERLPKVNLPIKIDIIKHPKEVDGKSTSAHAAVLAPDDIKIYNYPDFPSYENEKVLLIFPGKSAVPFKDWWNSQFHLQKISSKTQCNESALNSSESHKDNLFSSSSNSCDNMYQDKQQEESFSIPFSKVIFIDSTWRQSKALYSDLGFRVSIVI